MLLFYVSCQGFGDGIDEDVSPLRLFADSGLQFFVCNSFSKSFWLSGERVGVLSVVSQLREGSTRSLCHAICMSQMIFLKPSAHGAAVVSTVLHNPELRDQWSQELFEVRRRNRETRAKITARLVAHLPGRDFSFLVRQRGIFMFLEMTVEQITRLRSEFGIYVLGRGHICLTAITRDNINVVINAIVQVI